MNEPQNYVINAQLLQSTLNYLAGRPYGEVFQLISAIQQLQPHVEESNEKTDPVIQAEEA